MEKNYSVIKELFLLENQIMEKIDKHPGYKYSLLKEDIKNQIFDFFDARKIKYPKGLLYVRDIFTMAHVNIGRGKISAKVFIQLLRSLLAVQPYPIEVTPKDKKMIKKAVIQIVNLGFVMTKHEQDEDYERIKIGFQEFPEDVITDLCKFRNESDFEENIKFVCKKDFEITREIEKLKKAIRQLKSNLADNHVRGIYSKHIKSLRKTKNNLKIELRLKKLLWQLKKDYYKSTLSRGTGASAWCPHCGANGTGNSLILRPANPLRPRIFIGDARRKPDYYCNHGTD